MNNARYGLVCDIDKLPFSVGDESFLPMTLDQVWQLIITHTWSDNRYGLRRSYGNPVYSYLVPVDQFGDILISNYCRFIGDDRQPVRWFRGGWVPSINGIDIDPFNIFNAITKTIGTSHHVQAPDKEWGEFLDEQDKSDFIGQEISFWESWFNLGVMDIPSIDHMFMAGSFTSKKVRMRRPPSFWGALIIILVINVHSEQRSEAEPLIPDIITNWEQPFISSKNLKLLDECTDLDDANCPLRVPFLNAIMDLSNSKF